MAFFVVFALDEVLFAELVLVFVVLDVVFIINYILTDQWTGDQTEEEFK